LIVLNSSARLKVSTKLALCSSARSSCPKVRVLTCMQSQELISLINF